MIFSSSTFRFQINQYREVSVRLLFFESCLATGAIVDTKNDFLDEFLKQYKKTSSPIQKELGPESLRQSVLNVLNGMTAVFEKKDPLLQARASVVIYYLLFRSAIKSNRLASISRRGLVAFVDKVERNRETAEKDLPKADFALLECNRLFIQGTNDASSTRERLRIIAEIFMIEPNYGHKGVQKMTQTS